LTGRGTYRGTGVPPATVWNWTPAPNHIAQTVAFDEFASGWNDPFTDEDSELAIFEKVFCPEALEICIEETNRYADQTGNCRTKRWEKWVAVGESDMMRYLAIRMLMGLNKKPQIRQYWSRDPLFASPIIGELMSQDRYGEISKYLHFCNNEELVDGDRLLKIRKIWDVCMNNFQNC